MIYKTLKKTILIVSLILATFIYNKCQSEEKQNNQNETNQIKQNSNKDLFKQLSDNKISEDELDYIKKEEIIKTDVVAVNKKTSIRVRDFKVSITQIDNSKFPEVTLVISVTDNAGNPLIVNPDFFRIEENGFKVPKNNILQIVQKQEISDKQNEKPLNIILALDKSRSMSAGSKEKDKQALHFAKEAAIEFIKQSEPNDIVRVIAFDGDLHLLGTNENAIPRIRDLNPKGSTALYAVLLNSVKELQLGSGIKAVILLTDGKNDTRGTINKYIKSITFNDGIYAANQLAIPVFTIGFGSKADQDTLSKIAKSTHGAFFSTGKKEEIQTLYRKIKDIINTQYLITYKSTSLQEVTDVQIAIGPKIDKRTFSTPDYIVNREKQLREEIKIVKQREDEINRIKKDAEANLIASIKKEKEIEELRMQIQNELNSIKERTREIEEKEKELRLQEEQIDNTQRELDNLKEQLKIQEQEIISKNTSLNKKQEKLNQIENAQELQARSLSKKDSKIQSLEETINNKTEQLEKDKARISETQIQIENKTKELSRLINSNKNLEGKLKAKQEKLDKESLIITKLKNTLHAILKNVKSKYKKAINEILEHEKELDELKAQN